MQSPLPEEIQPNVKHFLYDIPFTPIKMESLNPLDGFKPVPAFTARLLGWRSSDEVPRNSSTSIQFATALQPLSSKCLKIKHFKAPEIWLTCTLTRQLCLVHRALANFIKFHYLTSEFCYQDTSPLSLALRRYFRQKPDSWQEESCPGAWKLQSRKASTSNETHSINQCSCLRPLRQSCCREGQALQPHAFFSQGSSKAAYWCWSLMASSILISIECPQQNETKPCTVHRFTQHRCMVNMFAQTGTERLHAFSAVHFCCAKRMKFYLSAMPIETNELPWAQN